MGSKSSSKAAKGSKQNASKASGGKLQSQETQIEKEPSGDHIDLSMLRKPIDVSASGVGQVVKVYQTGTAEVCLPYIIHNNCNKVVKLVQCFIASMNMLENSKLFSLFV
jgi:hypothetical protein